MKRRIILQTSALVFLGCIVRFIYGIIYQPWTVAPDHIAMEILVENGGWSYAHLIHYPHEGGTIITSILGRFVALFTSFNSLVVVAFILDLLSRFFQLIIVRKITNPTIFWAFGIWTIFAVPIMIPWATVNFGLHAISDIFPFLLLYMVYLKRDDKKHLILMGVFIGLSVWFSYNNVILLLPFFILPLVRKGLWKNWMLGCASFIGVMLLHYLVRMNFDYGFELTKLDLGSIRGADFQWSDPETYHRLYKVWTNPLAESAVVIQNTPYVLFAFKYIWLGFVCLGILGFLFRKKIVENASHFLIEILMVVSFVMLYAISPFYYDNDNFGNQVNYRHFSYIMPLIAFITIWGLSFLPFKRIFTTIFLGFSIYLGIIVFTIEPSNGNADMAAGWVLSKKFGAHPQELQTLIVHSSYDQSELIKGVGWGVTSVFFGQVSSSDTALVNERVTELKHWKDDFLIDHEMEFNEGVEFAFDPYITPALDPALLAIIKARIP
ncbi:MAG: hypothetical protein GQ574_06425 [Crocinitomix sp.]|nr:hypothetical protein [Crocinitomix sp.]